MTEGHVYHATFVFEDTKLKNESMTLAAKDMLHAHKRAKAVADKQQVAKISTIFVESTGIKVWF